jgi:hypothetical protein
VFFSSLFFLSEKRRIKTALRDGTDTTTYLEECACALRDGGDEDLTGLALPCLGQ